MGVFVTLPEDLIAFSQALGGTFRMLLTKVPREILKVQCLQIFLANGGINERGKENRECKNYCFSFVEYYMQKTC